MSKRGRKPKPKTDIVGTNNDMKQKLIVVEPATPAKNGQEDFKEKPIVTETVRPLHVGETPKKLNPTEVLPVVEGVAVDADLIPVEETPDRKMVLFEDGGHLIVREAIRSRKNGDIQVKYNRRYRWVSPVAVRPFDPMIVKDVDSIQKQMKEEISVSFDKANYRIGRLFTLGGEA